MKLMCCHFPPQGELVAGFTSGYTAQTNGDTYAALCALLHHHHVGLTVSGVHMAGECQADEQCHMYPPLA